MHLLSLAILAVLTCAASSAFTGEFASIFNTWNPSEDVRLVDDFDHLTQIFHPQKHEDEHARRKRNADETARFSAGAPITKGCNRPGYTGQYCEFPICESFNPKSNPEQYLRDEGYVIDLTDLGNCTRVHKIIVDETMYDIHIEVQSLENVSPQLIIMDSQGCIGTPDRIVQEDDRFVAVFNSLPFGAYTVKPSAASLNSRCILTTTAQTTLTISGGFQTDDRDRNDFPNENAGAHQFNSILLTLNGGRAPSTLKTVSVVGPDNYVLRPRVLDKRYGCQYEFYFDSLFCYNRGSYALIVEGIDFFGNLFRRVAPFECVIQSGPSTPSVPPTTPVPTNPTSCANGGVLLEADGNTTCACQDHWTGYDCSQALCVNGGTRIQSKCFCPIGFEGTHCEHVKCEPNSNHGFGVDRPTLVIVARVRKTQNSVMKQVQKAIDEVVANLQFDRSYLSRFHLVLFNNKKIILSKQYSSINDFDWDFELRATQSTDTFGNCNDDVLGALAAALVDVSLTQGSTAYVITDALADDYSAEIEGIIQMNSFWRATINFVVVHAGPNSKCTVDLTDPGFRAFDDVANRFGGLAWYIDDVNKVYDVLYGHMNSIMYKSQLMLTLDREECSKGLGKVIQIENTAETIVFISRGRDFHLDVTSPDGTSVKPRTVVKEGTFTVMRWSTPLAGTYMVKASSDAPSAACSLRAYQASKQSLSLNPQTEAYWAITTDVDTDGMMYQPLAGMDNHPVFHIEDFGDDVDHAFAFLNMYAVRNSVEQEVYASNGLYRGGCTFQFYFPSFRCRPNENLHYEFNLRNDQGFYVQRAGVMTCFNYVPTPSAPTECQNGGVKYNGTCLCVSHYEGEHCQNLICENGGTSVFGTCQCPVGWTGPFCVYPQCSESGPLPSYGYHVDMAFLVEVTPKGVDQINFIQPMLPEIMRDISAQHRDWIDRVVLVGYDSKGVVGMVDSPITNLNKFYNTLTAWANSKPEETMNCRVQIWQALDMLLNGRKDGDKKRSLPHRSIINIIEASLPDQDRDGSLIYSTSEELLERRAITNVFESKDWNAENGFPCGGKNEDFFFLDKIARRGDGLIYILGNEDLGNALRMIPTLFSSSIVYKYFADDCAHVNNIYFPIDAYTQTLTAVVFGSKTSIGLRKRDPGNGYYYTFPDEGRIDILKDDRNLVVEYRNPCDNDWEPVSQSCMYYSKTVEKNYDDALALCESMGGFMADDLTDTKNDWLSFVLGGKQGWLGLHYLNGEWLFLEANGNTMAPPPHMNKWITGQAPADDSKGACAYTYNGLWYPMTCDREYVVICQKHMYDHQNLPSSIADDDLSPGYYYLVIQTDINAPYRGCEVEIRVQSDLNIEYGFVDGLRRDSPHPVANVDSNDNRVVSSVSLGQAKAQNSFLQYVQLRTSDPTSTLLEAATFSYRLGCTYEFVSQEVNCDLTNGTDFSVVLIGEDDTGNTFQRYSTSLCSNWYDCKNGGVYSNGQCLCTDYYAGDNCETPVCQNGGKLPPSGTKCSCPTGYSGDACQFVHCDDNSRSYFTNDEKALVLVLEKSSNTADAIKNIADSLHLLVQFMWDRHQGWIDKYMVLTFTMDGTIEELDVYYYPDQFAQYLLQLSNEARALPGGCQMPIWKAMDSLFDSPNSQYLKGSEVLLVSAAAPMDVDKAAINSVMEKFDIQTPIVDFLHIETAQCAIDDWAKDLSGFTTFLSTTGGIFFRVQSPQVALSVLDFVPTRYAAQTLSFSDPFNCKNNDIYVQVDTGMSTVYVMIAAKGAIVQVETPRKDPIEGDLTWNTDEEVFWTLEPKYPGIYRITINADSDTCFPVVYGSGYSVTSGFPHASQVFFGFIQNYNYIDTPKPYAVYGAVNFPVFYIYELEGQEIPTETLYTARMTRMSIDGEVEESYTSDVDPREGCSYNYIGKAFTCVRENDVITLSVSGVDSYNQPFTRQTTTYCKIDAKNTQKIFTNITNVLF